MRHKVYELEGALLDAAVSKASGCDHGVKHWDMTGQTLVMALGPDGQPWWPSVRWEHGGPIIERERIVLFIGEVDRRGAMPWTAWAGGVAVTALSGLCDFVGPDDCVAQGSTGRTPLIAAMRAYVTSKFGEEVELP